MSAPPRSTVTVRPLSIEPLSASRSWDNPAPQGPASGMRLVTRVRIDDIIRARIRGALPKPGMEVTRAAGLDPAFSTDHRRLLAAVVLARAATGGRRAGRAAMRDAAALPDEALHDELTAIVRQLDGRALGLPAFGVIRLTSPAAEYDAFPVETDFARALFVQCHRYGDVFARDADPIPQLTFVTVDLIAPAGEGHA